MELHVDGADWQRHQHQADEGYNNVVLHVVYKNAVPAYRQDGTRIPCLLLGDYLATDFLTKYGELMHNLHWIPCERHLAAVSPILKSQLLDRMLAERMQQQCQRINSLYEETGGDWERVLFIQLCRSFGMKVNAEVFMELGKLIDLSVLRKYQDDALKQQALLFGQAGLLDDAGGDSYRKRLKDEYHYLSSIHHTKSLPGYGWKFMRMRPTNFPTFRLAQLIGVYGLCPYLFGKVIDCDSTAELTGFLKKGNVDRYWEDHFRFDATTAKHNTMLSESFMAHLIINAFAPVIFCYGQMMDVQELKCKALDWLAAIPAEDNAQIRRFKSYGLAAQAASDTQALLFLKRAYCDKRRCLSCVVGLSLFKA